MGSYFVETGDLGSQNWKFNSYLESPTWQPYRSGESCVDQLHAGPPYREGGPFRKIKIEYRMPGNGQLGVGSLITNFKRSLWPDFGRVKYTGVCNLNMSWPGSIDMIHLGANLAQNSPLIPSTSSLDGAAWDKTKPKIEQGGLFVALAEIRDVPHMLKKSAEGFHDAWSLLSKKSSWRQAPKIASDHFLNHNFGWVPFLKDVKDTINNVINANDRIGRLTNENGKWIRRRAILVNQRDVVTVNKGAGWSIWPSDDDFLNIASGHYQQPSWEIQEEKWTHAESVGSFRYYLPEFDKGSDNYFGALNTVKRQIDLHGARVNPSNIYKAIPWTWLVDWVSGAGRNIQIAQDQTLDNMAARYLYLTHHQVSTLTLRNVIPFNAASGGTKVFEFTQVTDVKQRREAESPYGFSLPWDGLTPKQLAILAALGISRKS